MAVIHLGAALPQRSSHLPADSASSVIVRLLGVAPDGGCRVSPAPASVLTKRERLVSVALFLAFIAARADDLMASGRYPASRSAEPGLSSPRPGSFLRTGSDGLADFEGVFYTAPLARDTRQLSVSPALSGTTECSPNAYASGTVHDSRRSVIVSELRGRP